MATDKTIRQRAASIMLAACAVLATPALAGASDDNYGNYRNVEQHILGRVISFEPWRLQLDRGPRMVLHRGTVIHPTGLTLRNGMAVRVIGHVTADGAFSADQIELVQPSTLIWEHFRS
ncbi:MAG TPA: hypothetical protein VFE70_02225 [Candidatus Elarobacter sp.]|nr:hypothetical protein [Candidatus Elarobacter sp.]